MIIGTLFTLFVVPSIYVLVARTHAAVADEERDRDAAGPGTAGKRRLNKVYTSMALDSTLSARALCDRLRA